MKRYFFLIIFLTNFVFSYDKEINIYTWAGYFPKKVIKNFEKKENIKVNLSYFESNENLFEKIKNKNSKYDIIIPSSYIINKLKKYLLLKKIDINKINNYKYINKKFIFNKYSIPFLWGSTGIVINKKYFNTKKFHTWDNLWNKKLKNKLLILNDFRDVFSIALLKLGYSPNDRNIQHIKKAYLEIKKLLPNIKLFNSNTIQSIYSNEDVNIGIGWSCNAYKAIEKNPNIQYILPKKFFVWLDSIAILKETKKDYLIYKFINFILSKKNIIKIINFSKCSSAENVNINIKNSKLLNIINPRKTVIKNAILEKELPYKIQKVYIKYWELIKIY